ncbi:Protein of unknown function [Kushneria avicenniae]|uniref:Membrane-anchored ribosome-binding protein, inhibits growth in stationary phase, ElaB/YqjD/DUF883 family n=1 Tax=Kushneria avicenniae TaxID=402385 RepID=A0A1I1LWB7_9GAMM|nr:DUF3618 domain-containing protein [Kushneria avicenniae]SFC73780.1 Protein of unknown function [Kushneria avicenniae]
MSDHNQDQQDTRSPEEIEADINRTRSHLDDTLSDFQERFSSDHMMHSAMEYVKSDSARDYFSNLGRSIRDNPMPAAMIGVGIGWLIYSQSSGSSRSDVPTRFNDKRQKQARHAAADTTPQTHEYDELYDEPLFDEPLYSEGESVDQYYSSRSSQHDDGGLRQRASDAMHGAGDKARSVKDGAGERAHNFKSGAGDRMHRMKQGSSDRLHNASSKARDTGSWLSDMAHDNPVAAGALGLAAGALLGSLLPASRAEQRAMGDTRDHLVDRASEVGSEQLDRASDKAQEATDRHTSDDSDHPQRNTSSNRGRPFSTDDSDSEPHFDSTLSTDHVPGSTRPGN